MRRRYLIKTQEGQLILCIKCKGNILFENFRGAIFISCVSCGKVYVDKLPEKKKKDRRGQMALF